MVYSNRITPLLFVGLLAITAVGRAQEPPSRLPRPSLDLERFRALEPSERLRAIEKFELAKSPFVAVTKGDLVAAIVERGAIAATDCVDVICQLKASGKESGPSATIKWVIEEGTIVKKGDQLITFDDSALRERVDTVKINARIAEAASSQADAGAALAQQEADIDVRLAEIEVKFSELELKDPAPGASKAVLELKVERAKLHLDRAKTRAKAQQVAADAEKRARAATVQQEMQKLRSIEAELAHCEVTSPIDGLVVYEAPSTGRFGGAPALVEPGAQVREGQKLLRVCEMKQFAVATRIHEAVISTVRTGQPTQVRIDAFPGRVLDGKVSAVSPTAAAPDFTTRDIKVYPVTITIDTPPPGLKPHMSAEVQIKTGERKGVLQVPLTAVLLNGRNRFCFVKVGQELVEREVIVGANNATSVEIKEGLKEGEEVFAPPPGLLISSSGGSKAPAKGKAK